MKEPRKIVFAVSTVFHIEHLKRVYEKWDGAEFLLFTAKDDTRTRLMAAHLEQMGASWRHISDFLASGDRSDVMISVYWQPSFLVMGSSTMHVRLMYGYAKDDWNYGLWNRNYDWIFVYGPYAEERLRHHAPCVSVGHPRSLSPDRYNELTREVQPVQKQRPVLLYCPTYGEMSSLEEFDRVLVKLVSTYEVVVKLHHLSHADHYPQLALLVRKSRVRLYDQRTDLFDLLPSCDLVISDHSGAIFDAMLLGKNVVLVDSDVMKRTINDQLWSDSANLDIKVRRVLPHYEVRDIVEGIRKSLEHPADYSDLLELLYVGIGTNVPDTIRYEIRIRYRQFMGVNKQHGLFSRLKRFLLTDHRELVICGAGDFGQAILHLANSMNCTEIRFIDGDPAKQGEKVAGITVYPPNELMSLSPFRYKCVVATTRGSDIYEQCLNKMGFVSNKDYMLAF